MGSIPALRDAGVLVAWVTGGVLAGILLRALVQGRLLAAARRGWPAWETAARGIGKMPIVWLASLGAALALDSVAWPGPVEQHVRTALVLLVGITVTVAAMRVATGLIRYYASSATGPVPSTTIFINITRIAVLAIGLLIVLNAVGVAIGPLLGALGVGGLAVALALQDTLSNLFAGVQIIAGKQLRLGDYVQLATGQEGYVEDITWRYTTIRQLSNNLVVVPNATLATTIFTNYRLPADEFSILVDVGVAYDADLDKAARIAAEVAAEVVAEMAPDLGDWEPAARFTTFGESSVNLRVVLRTVDFANQWELRHRFITRLARRFADEGIEIPYPQRVVHLHQPPAAAG